jgi:hypothetical protein
LLIKRDGSGAWDVDMVVGGEQRDQRQQQAGGNGEPALQIEGAKSIEAGPILVSRFRGVLLIGVLFIGVLFIGVLFIGVLFIGNPIAGTPILGNPTLAPESSLISYRCSGADRGWASFRCRLTMSADRRGPRLQASPSALT